MECFEAEALLVDYIDAQLQPNDKKALEQHLQSCEQCKLALEEYRQLFTSIEKNKTEIPSPALREKFDTMLQSEINIAATAHIIKDNNNGKVVRLNRRSLLLRIAASIILVAMGVFAGTQFRQSGTVAGSAEMADLKNEVKQMKETMLFNLLNEESASERIKAVSYADEINNPDTKIINALLETMNEDKNVNVRLAALYAVSKYTDSKIVSDALVGSLNKQSEPLMQIALINILTEKKEIKAIGPIRNLLQDKKTLQPVKDIAQKGLKLL